MPAPEPALRKNPLELNSALLFAFMFVVVSMATKYTLLYYKGLGLRMLSFLVGCSDITPFVISVLQGNLGHRHPADPAGHHHRQRQQQPAEGGLHLPVRHPEDRQPGGLGHGAAGGPLHRLRRDCTLSPGATVLCRRHWG